MAAASSRIELRELGADDRHERQHQQGDDQCESALIFHPQSLDGPAQRREVEARTLIEKRRFHWQVLGTLGGSQFLPRDDTATRACAATMIINFTPVPIIQ